MKMARWLLILPSACLAWYVVFVVGVFAFPTIEAILCPPSDMISGTCMNLTVVQAMEVVFHTFVGLAAVAVVFAAVIVAPSRKRMVAWVAVVVGGLVSVILAQSLDTVSEAVVAVLAGLAAAYINGRFGRPKPD